MGRVALFSIPTTCGTDTCCGNLTIPVIVWIRQEKAVRLGNRCRADGRIAYRYQNQRGDGWRRPPCVLGHIFEERGRGGAQTDQGLAGVSAKDWADDNRWQPIALKQVFDR